MIAREIPDDLQAVFLIVAAAALIGLPCPSDAAIAALCGQHAPGRARSRLRHLEKSDRLVVRAGLSGSRAIVVPDLGWETGWNDPTADSAARAPRSERSRPNDPATKAPPAGCRLHRVNGAG